MPDETKPTLKALRDVGGAKETGTAASPNPARRAGGYHGAAVLHAFARRADKALLAALFFAPKRVSLNERADKPPLTSRRLGAPVAAYLRSKRGFILVSHDRAFA